MCLRVSVSSSVQRCFTDVSVGALALPDGRALTRVDDVCEFGMGLNAWHVVYEQLTPGRFEGGVEELWIDDGLEILRETGNRSVWTAGCNRLGMVSLGIPVAGGGAGMYCGVPIQDGAVSWLPGGGDFEIFSRERMDIVSATVSESLLCAFAAIDSPQTMEASWRRPFLRQQPRHAALLRRALIEIVAAVRRQPGLLEVSASRAAMRDCVLSLMLDTLSSASARPTPDLRPSVKAWIVRKVREQALASPSEPLHVADVCRSLAVSRRSLQYAFEDLAGMGAVEFLRNVRLNAVRRELRVPVACPDEPIAAIAARWGFWHMPRFAAYYRAMFGERPSETRRRQGLSTLHGLG